jgi:hypothetical protein
MYYAKFVLYCYLPISCYIAQSYASKHDIHDSSVAYPAQHTLVSLRKITLKEHLQQVGQQLKKLPVRACACHVSLKNYRKDEFKAALNNFKKNCTSISLEHENKQRIKQSIRCIRNLLESIYTYISKNQVKPNTGIRICEKEQIVAECSYFGLHDPTESSHALAYYNELLYLLHLYHYYPKLYITELIHNRILIMEENLSHRVSAHFMEHIYRHSVCFLSVLSFLPQQYYYLSDTLIQELVQLTQAYKNLVSICYVLHNPTPPSPHTT